MTERLEVYQYHPAARSTPALVGRDKILTQIREAVEKHTGVVVFYILGEGGIGKTRLLIEILRLCHAGDWKSPAGPLLAAKEPVDLYHTQTHSLEGLVRAMGAVVRPEIRTEFFQPYMDELETLEQRKPDLNYALREVTELRERITRTFIECFRRMTEGYRTVMAFDTAEMLLYETDAIQQTLRLGAEGVGVRRWLVEEFFPSASNAVLLIAGRPREQLQKDLQNSLGDRLQVIELDKFEEDETLSYFDEVAAAARADGEKDVAQRIENIPENSRRVLHLLADGRPILLSLAMDLIALARQLPDEVKILLSEARKLSPGELKARRAELESSITAQFQQIGSPADEAIRSLAFARKGMEPVLLARVADMEEEEARQILSALTGLRLNGGDAWPEAIQELRPLSFIKIRPADRRVFLHDEMYELMARHVLARLPEADVRRAQQAILEYYDRELEKNRQEIEKLQPDERQEITPDRHIMRVKRPAMSPDLLERRAKAEIYQDYLMAERVHYMLHYEPLLGFQTYCIYAEIAYEENDESLDMQLRDELLAFVNAPERKDQAEIDGLRHDEVDLDAGIRWIKRNIRQQPEQASRIARRLREECADLIAQGGEVGAARLDVWEGAALAYVGDLGQSEKLLRHAIQSLYGVQPQPEDEFHQWQRKLELASAHNYLGYTLVRCGRYRQAVEAYKHALPWWRRLGRDYKAEHANTLNNLSWALAELGDFDDALQRCADGLELRRELGGRYPIALSYNTMGQIQTRNDQPHRARANCEHALTIFRELEMMRGVGMSSISLSEAHRRMSPVEGVYFPEEQAQKMREAVQYALDAVAIFGPYEQWPNVGRDEPLVAEPPRLVEALIQLGCAYRDWAYLYPTCAPLSDDPDQEMLAQLGERALREAAQSARDQQPHRAVGALVNLAWLRYYTQDPDGVEAVAKEVRDMIEDRYFISQEASPPPSELDLPEYWLQLGKLHLLKGHIAFDQYSEANVRYRGTREQGDQKEALTALKESAEIYLLSLAYDDLYGEGQMFRDLKRGIIHIYDRYKGLNIDEMRIVADAIQAATEVYHLEQPRLAALMDKWFVVEVDSE
jgi:hypothetical protein